jgi:hypothetical protein
MLDKETIINLAHKAELDRIYNDCAEKFGGYAYEHWDSEIEEFARLVAEHVLKGQEDVR